MVGSWRLATRLARREIRRRPMQALLVVLLIAVPVFALTVADVLVETQKFHDGAESFRRTYGPASVAFSVEGTVDPGFAPALPIGSKVVSYASAELPLTPVGGQGLRTVRVLNLRVTDAPAFAGLQLTDGWQAEGRELMLSRGVADWLGVEVGDRVRFERPQFSGRVSGIVRSLEDFETPVLVSPGFDFGVVRQPGLVRTSTSVALPSGYWASSFSDVAVSGVAQGTEVLLHGRAIITMAFPTLVAAGDPPAPLENVSVSVPEQFQDGSRVEPQARFWGWVAVALLLAGIAVIISAAFATTARRQLVTLGLLAANGGGPRFLRRTLTMQGTMLGVIGAALGVAGGLAALVLAQSWVENLYRHELDYVMNIDLLAIAATAIVAATIAARFPARSTSRVPVLAALAGRRPLAPVPPLRWLKAAVVFGTGVALLGLVAVVSRDGTSARQTVALVAIVGGLFVMAGAAYLAPVVVEVLARCSSRVGPSARIAARSLVRVRSRSAAVVTAGAVAGALGIAVVTAILGVRADRDWERDAGLPANVVAMISSRVANGLTLPTADELAQGQRRVEGVLPGVKFRPIEGFLADAVTDVGVGPSRFAVFVDSPQLRRLLVLSASAERVLTRDGALWDDGSFVAFRSATSGSAAPQSVTLRPGAASDSPTMVVEQHPVGWRARLVSESSVIVTPERARELGVVPVVVGAVGVTPKPISEAQRDPLYRPDGADPYGAQVVAAPNQAAVLFVVASESTIPPFWRGFWNPARIQMWIAGVASLFVLLVVGIGLLLGAAEGSDERTVLAALGAKPRSRRRMSAATAYLLAAGGALLAVPAGFIPIAVVFQALQKDGSLTERGLSGATYPRVVFPSITVIAILVIIPIVASLLAWVASAIGQRAHAFRGTLAFDDD